MRSKKPVRIFLRALLVVIIVIVVLLLSVGLILTRPFAEAPWEEAATNPVQIYQSTGLAQDIPIISPFHLVTDPMEGLLLINFEGDPDEVYIGLEPQQFDDAVHGRGLLVIGWRVDGKVDVYHQSGLKLDPATYGIAGKGLHALVGTQFSKDHMELGPAGAQVDIAFSDLLGRPVRLVVRESDTRPRTPFGLLAPMGDAATEPPALPLVYVDEFYFVRRAGTEFLIEIGGRSHRNDPIPLVLDGTRVHFLRYSAAPFIVSWNPDADAKPRLLEPGDAMDTGHRVAMADGVRYELEMNGPFHEIRRMSRRDGEQEVLVGFSPAFPQLLALAEGTEVSGAFRISAQPSVGTVRGSWRVLRQGGAIHMEVAPDGGWTPGPAPRMARLLFRVVPTFQEWPKTYVWRGVIELPSIEGPAGGTLGFRSGWERIAQ
jgi:hypothetical protein